jgi:hypothetical protein
MEAEINVEAIKSEIRQAIINKKANACPIAMRLAWHSSGTFDKRDGTGGSNGATMRFSQEASDPANKGLSIVRDMLYLVKQRFPEISYADLWCLGSISAIEFAGGPKIPFKFGRKDEFDPSHCPPNGRLPDASKGADHIREVFGRMGFNDQEMVALIGGHTLGSCHLVRSGYDGPWTRNPLKFDNQFFKNLMGLEWRKKKWDGPEQFEDIDTGELMMLPTDMALRTDPKFRVWSELYAKDQQRFFDDFAKAYAKLICLGVPQCDPFKIEETKPLTETEELSLKFRAAAMHGSLSVCQELEKKGANVHEQEKSSGRTALHKAAFWGHDATVYYLANDCKLNLNAVDYNGDTALHDATRFGHEKVVQILLNAKADITIKNRDGKDPIGLSIQYDKLQIGEMLRKYQNRSKL